MEKRDLLIFEQCRRIPPRHVPESPELEQYLLTADELERQHAAYVQYRETVKLGTWLKEPV